MEGYIKFNPQWTVAPPLPEEQIEEINRWRGVAYWLGLIGMYPDGIGYGNISVRLDAEGRFLISGSATGGLPELDARHYCVVKSADPERNTVVCEGPIVASSESMSHAAIYLECPEVRAVIHAHHPELWRRLLYRVPTTDGAVTYGSPEMAREITRLLQETDLRQTKIFVTEGHEDGIFAFGESLEEAVTGYRQGVPCLYGATAYTHLRRMT
jgi:L-ribulose-5-phosphate 4-epimerase